MHKFNMFYYKFQNIDNMNNDQITFNEDRNIQFYQVWLKVIYYHVKLLYVNLTIVFITYVMFLKRVLV